MVYDAGEIETLIDGDEELELKVTCHLDVPVLISSGLWESLSRIPFRSVGTVTLRERVAEVLRRAESALDRHWFEKQNLQPSPRFAVRFAAEVPTSSAGPRFRHLGLVFALRADGTPLIQIGELHEVPKLLWVG